MESPLLLLLSPLSMLAIWGVLCTPESKVCENMATDRHLTVDRPGGLPCGALCQHARHWPVTPDVVILVMNLAGATV